MSVAQQLATDPSQPSVRVTWLGRRFPNLCFYARIAMIVWRASRAARRGRYDDEAWVASSRAVIRALQSVGVRFRFENLESVRRAEGPVVLVGNHMSTLETFVLPAALRPMVPVTFIVKRQLVEMPVFKHVMISRQPIVVGRSHAREDLRVVLEEGEARLRAGVSVVVFPQTTRSVAWSPAEFNSMAVKLAKRAGVPVVPCALRTDAWGIGRRFKDLGPIRPDREVRFSFGEPIAVTGNGREAQEGVVRFITARMRDWGVPVIERTPDHSQV